MIELTINNQKHTLDLDPETPLLWVLRDELGLIGTKFGCGMAQCGACTVHINGNATRSCVTTIKSAQGMDVTTIEHLAAHKIGGLLQTAWIDQDVPQCGYCQAGQLMSATALLESNPTPSDAEIEQFMSGNLCRCGTYTRIKKAIKQAAVQIQGAES